MSWQHVAHAEMSAEEVSRWGCKLEQVGSVVRLTMTHETATKDSKLIGKVSYGWPAMLSALKTWLETGETIPEFMQLP